MHKRYDMSDTLHFVAPPYVGNDMGHYSGMFSMDDFQRLLELLSQIRGKFVLTMYPSRRQEEWIVCNYAEPEGIEQVEMKGRAFNE